MWDGMAFSSISGTLLEKVARDERLGRELPRRGRDPKPERGRAGETETAERPGDGETDETPASSVHIDLRI